MGDGHGTCKGLELPVRRGFEKCAASVVCLTLPLWQLWKQLVFLSSHISFLSPSKCESSLKCFIKWNLITLAECISFVLLKTKKLWKESNYVRRYALMSDTASFKAWVLFLLYFFALILSLWAGLDRTEGDGRSLCRFWGLVSRCRITSTTQSFLKTRGERLKSPNSLNLSHAVDMLQGSCSGPSATLF